MKFTRVIVLLCWVVFLTFRPADDLWADRIYTWTDKSGIVHLTQTSPPSGVALDSVINNPPGSPNPSRRSPDKRSSSIWNWQIHQAEMRVRQAQQRLLAAEKIAQQAEVLAEDTTKRSRHYIDTHDNNQYMRRVFKFKMRQAYNAAKAADAKAREAGDNLRQAEQQYHAAQQQLKEAQEDANTFSRLN